MNTPNTITLTRILMIPLIIFFYLADFIPYAKLVAAILFILACVTDFLDGFIARKYNKVTTLGKFFDAIADKVLIMTGLVLIVAVPSNIAVVHPNELGVVCMILILAREFIVSALRQLAAAKGKVLAADMGGKIKACAQYVTVSAFMILAFVQKEFLGNTIPTACAIIRFILMIFLVATTVLTIYSGASYIIRNRHVFVDSQKPIDVKPAKKENKEVKIEPQEEIKAEEVKEENKEENEQDK